MIHHDPGYYRRPNCARDIVATGRYRNGDTIRTDQYRFTVYSGPKNKPLARMLYDHTADPTEDVNISENEGNRQVVGSLRKQLIEGKGKDR